MSVNAYYGGSVKIMSVTELTFAIKSILEPRFKAVSVRGEISNLKIQSSGHVYFSLKDAGAQLSAVLFKGNASQLSKMPKDGDQVVALGELSIYAPRGGYQLIARELQFLGVGELLLKLHQLKELLAKRGWFDSQHKKPLPKLPRRIGVITSPTGAVIQDILNVLTRRFQDFHVILNPVKVQGDGAAQEIAQAIFDFNKFDLADVLIVGRGGGSIEDLWAFNEEIVAQAIFESKIPIISAVGHETDHTLADCVADVRAPTPSAAAEIAIAEKANLLKFLTQCKNHLQQRIQQQLIEKRQKLSALQRHSLFSSPYALLSPIIQRLDDLQSELEQALKRQCAQNQLKIESLTKQLSAANPIQKIEQWKTRLKNFPDRFTGAIDQILRQKRERCVRITDHFRSIHPQKLLQKGYAILFAEKHNSVILSAKEITPKQTIRAMLHDGQLAVTVETVEYDPGNHLF
jgi:exodeoxyribonuclease VII large subunit